MEIKNKKSFNDLIKSLAEEIIEEEDLDEITATGNIDGYNTPFAFSGKKGKKKNKEISTNSTGYDVVNEALDEKDLKQKPQSNGSGLFVWIAMAFFVILTLSTPVVVNVLVATSFCTSNT